MNFILLLTLVTAFGNCLPIDERERIRDVFVPPTQSFNLNSIKICAFNIKSFGISKMNKHEVVEDLVKILMNFDVTLIQEIRDRTGLAIEELLEELNAATTGDHFSMVISDRLGRSNYKEQYAYFYRASKFVLLKTYQWPEDRQGDNWFERPPFIAHFKAYGYDLSDFRYMGIHTKPTAAVAEIDHLADVYNYMTSVVWTGWQAVQGYIIGGDFNADCSYVRTNDWPNIRLRTQTGTFTWVIYDDADTSVAPTNCAYDRFVLTGALRTTYISNSAAPFNFRTAYNLTYAQARAVSDHWPIVMESK